MEVYRAFLQMQKTLEESQALFSDPDLGAAGVDTWAVPPARLHSILILVR